MYQKVETFRHPVLDHFYRPRNAGIAAGFNRAFLEQDNPWLVRIRFTLRVASGRIEEVKFQAQSCVTTAACCSALTEMTSGQTVERALAITPEELSEYLGIIPEEKMYCARLAVATLQRALGRPTTAEANVYPKEESNQ